MLTQHNTLIFKKGVRSIADLIQQLIQPSSGTKTKPEALTSLTAWCDSGPHIFWLNPYVWT